MTITAEQFDAPATSTAARTTGRWRSMLGWVGMAAAVCVFAMVVAALTVSTPDSRGGLDPESAKGSGSLALAELLRDQGVQITVARTRDEARAALDDDATLVMADPFSLSDEAVSELVAHAGRTVFLSSSTRVLRLFDLGENAQPAASALLTPQCGLAAFANIGAVQPNRFFAPAPGVTGCFGSDGVAGLLVDDRNDARVVLIEGRALFTNDHLAENGNAALGLALLGQTRHAVWYVPSLTDSDIEAQSTDTLAALTPEWVTLAILLLLLAGALAAIARGRRFGPLVAETLPVTVRASETMHGRARLTAKAGDAAHAAAALREGTIRRLASRLGLSPRSTATEAADAAADMLRIPRGSLHELLGGELPRDDAELVETARRLAELETAVDTAVHVERNTP